MRVSKYWLAAPLLPLLYLFCFLGVVGVMLGAMVRGWGAAVMRVMRRDLMS